MTKNSSWLRYRATDGILETHFYADGGWLSYVALVEKALDLAKSEKRPVNPGYRLLDTFFSDSMSGELLKQIFKHASRASPVRMLVVDPTCPFAENRATSIGKESAAQRAHKGLKFIAEALKVDSSQEINVQDPDDPVLLSLIHKAQQQAYISIQFYKVTPSGPLYFFKDIVLCGRFCSGKSAIRLPWFMIVNDPDRQEDLYDMLAEEFEAVWKTSYKYPGGWLEKKRAVFLSYSEHDRIVAEEIRQRFKARGIECFVAASDLTPGDIWTDELRKSICNSTEVIVLLTPHSVLSPCVQAELGAAWAFNLRITPAILGTKLTEVLHFVENRQAIDVSTSEGIQRLVNAVADRMRKRLGNFDAAKSLF